MKTLSVNNKESELRLRIMILDVLKDLKKTMTYKEMSGLLNIQDTLLCRYVNGNTIPSEAQCRDILNKLERNSILREVLRSQIKMYGDGFVDTSRVLQYPSLLRLVIEIFIRRNITYSIDRIVTPAVNGIPFATIVSQILNKPLVIAKKYKDSIYFEYYEESIRESSAQVSNLYIRKDLINRGDKILIVDDVIRSGRTVDHLVRLLIRSGGMPKLVIAVVGNTTRRATYNGVEIKTIINV
ncbi:phosphoribosyltransferase [Sulfolobales archaeon HS-7]|nr:phosphoribosyltransferase [Sulfolobales archaeon HS-7]